MWFVKIETGIVPKPEFDRYVPAHKAYVQDLIDQLDKRKISYMIVVPKGTAWPPEKKDDETKHKALTRNKRYYC